VLSTGFLLAAAVAGTIWNVHLAGKIICSIMAGLLCLRMFVIYHDQQHLSILSNSKVAEGLMRVFGMLCLSPSTIWRSSHNYHHNHNSKLRGSHIGSFQIMTRDHFMSSPKGVRRKYLFMRHPLTIALGYFIVFLYGMCIAPTVRNPRKHYDSFLAFILHLGIALALFWHGGWPAVLLTLVVPLVIACAIGTYLFYAQHNFPGVTFNDRGGWTYDKAAMESSSFMKTGPVMSWFTANIGYHHIHHLNSRIPFYRLPEAVKAIPELQATPVTTLRVKDIIACLRLKVWDSEAQRMVGLRER
jgi:omega-6 fatty acid desaturase (delta-12 desaturase)